MATVFWDCHGVVLIECLEKGKTVTEAHFASLFNKLKAEKKESFIQLVFGEIKGMKASLGKIYKITRRLC